MKNVFRKLCAPVLRYFEAGEGEYSYKRSHRIALVVVGVLFLVLALVSLVAATASASIGAAFPFVVFLSGGLICLIVGGLGSDRAVAKIWGSK